VIERILPREVATAEAYGDPPEARLFAVEDVMLGGVAEARRREFTTGRHVARQALSRLGVPAGPLPRGPRRQPLWPVGVTGSITHCAGYRAAAVASAASLVAIGIDAEPNEPLPPALVRSVAGDAERGRLARLTRVEPAVCWDRLLFSVKESVYKTWFPLTHRRLGFADADVALDLDGTFHARLLVPPPAGPEQAPRAFAGRWLADGGFLLSAIAVRPHGSSR
jgi:4'-phosphopantetheinyl transferase EntD